MTLFYTQTQHLTQYNNAVSGLGHRQVVADVSPKSIASDRRRHRLHVVLTNLLKKREQLAEVTPHAMGLKESRNQSRLFTDAIAVVVRNGRLGLDQVLTVGGAQLVMNLCPNWWKGENSTISPLTGADRRIINETSRNWMLSGLDVVAFSYVPLPYMADQTIGWGSGEGGEFDIYLLNNGMPNKNASIGENC